MARIRTTLAVAALAGAVAMAGAPAAAHAQVPGVKAKPTFTPYTLKPELRNREAVADGLRESYPSLLRDAGIGGTAIYWIFIDRTGAVSGLQLFRTSGYQELDEAAARVARAMEFTPAENRGTPVDVWVQIPITFSSDSGAARQHEEEQRARQVQRRRGSARESVMTRAEIVKAPVFTPYTVKPELRNASEMASALRAEYPPLLRNAGIGGTAILWFLIDEDGQVLDRSIARSSGHAALDEAALSVADAMKFGPAMNRDEPVLVWVQIPVTFTSK